MLTDRARTGGDIEPSVMRFWRVDLPNTSSDNGRVPPRSHNGATLLDLGGKWF
jgi:hypothetical protein